MRPIRALAAALLAFLCILPAGGTFAQGASAREQRGAAPGQFDFYVLALSWSPGFCATGGADKGRRQCAPGAGLGFVVHGLWPQISDGRYPAECSAVARSPSRLAMRAADGLFPDEGLARYEWRRHGTCSGRSPSDYFAHVRRAREAVAIPPALKQPAERQRWTRLDLERAFVAANPGLRTDMMEVSCRRGTLQEILVCFSKDLRSFARCQGLKPRCPFSFSVEPVN